MRRFEPGRVAAGAKPVAASYFHKLKYPGSSSNAGHTRSIARPWARVGGRRTGGVDAAALVEVGVGADGHLLEAVAGGLGGVKVEIAEQIEVDERHLVQVVLLGEGVGAVGDLLFTTGQSQSVLRALLWRAVPPGRAVGYGLVCGRGAAASPGVGSVDHLMAMGSFPRLRSSVAARTRLTVPSILVRTHRA